MVDPNALTSNLGEIATLAEEKAEEAKRTYRHLTMAGASKSARAAAYTNLERVTYFSVITKEALAQSQDFLARTA